MTLALSDSAKRGLWLCAIWLAPLVDVGLVIHAQLDAPWFDARTGMGRWERTENPWPYCAVLLLSAAWLSARRLHTGRRLAVFALLAVAGSLADKLIVYTNFGSSLMIAALIALSFRSAQQKARSPYVKCANGMECANCGASLPSADAVCSVCDQALSSVEGVGSVAVQPNR